MTINFKHFINQHVTVLLKDGRIYDGMFVDSGRVAFPYAFMVNGERLWLYTYDGYVWYDKSNCPANIKSIRLINEMKTNYQELEQKAQEMQKTLDDMNKEIERLKKEEKEKQLPVDFSRKYAVRLLKNPHYHDLDSAFDWNSTPQGKEYWAEIHDRLYKNTISSLTSSVKMQIQEWVIESYRREFGD